MSSSFNHLLWLFSSEQSSVAIVFVILNITKRAPSFCIFTCRAEEVFPHPDQDYSHCQVFQTVSFPNTSLDYIYHVSISGLSSHLPMTRRAAFPECLVCAKAHSDSGQSSGCWTKDELAVGGGLSLALKSCWAAICLRVEADEPFCPEFSRLGVWLSGIVHWKQLWQAKSGLITLSPPQDVLQQLASVERNRCSQPF